MSASGRLCGLAVATVVLLLLPSCGVDASDDRKVPRAKPAAAASSAVRVVAVGDIACPPGARMTRTRCRHAATAALARRLRPDLVLPLGDTQYEEGTLRQYRRSYARSWGLLLSRTRPTIGNHEYKTPGARGYFTYFQGRQPGRPGYYRTTTRGGWAIYYLNSNCAKVSCAAQAAWLRRQMAARPTSCSIVTLHHPRYSSGDHGNYPSMKPMWQAAFRYHNDIVLSGHDHLYERFRPMDGAGRVLPSRGMQSFVVGTGGKSLYGFGTRKRGSVDRHNRAFGVLMLYLKPGSWQWSFRTIDGRVLDRGERRCL
jgi:hypothetical protein